MIALPAAPGEAVVMKTAREYDLPRPGSHPWTFARYVSLLAELNVLDLTGKRFPLSDSEK